MQGPSSSGNGNGKLLLALVARGTTVLCEYRLAGVLVVPALVVQLHGVTMEQHRTSSPMRNRLRP
jgi:hypothetical protein